MPEQKSYEQQVRELNSDPDDSNIQYAQGYDAGVADAAEKVAAADSEITSLKQAAFASKTFHENTVEVLNREIGGLKAIRDAAFLVLSSRERHGESWTVPMDRMSALATAFAGENLKGGSNE